MLLRTRSSLRSSGLMDGFAGGSWPVSRKCSRHSLQRSKPSQHTGQAKRRRSTAAFNPRNGEAAKLQLKR